MKNLEQIVKELSERAAREDHEKRNAAVLKIMSSLYDKSAAYTNIIMAAGYVGFFTVWSNMKVYMSAFDMRISALCMLISIMFFVMWEVTKMIVTSRSLSSLQDATNASPAEFNAKLEAYYLDAAKINAALMKWWSCVLFVTIVPALIAASILIFSFVTNL
jgi:hypothetical protein